MVQLFHSIDHRGLGRVTITDFEKAFDTEAMQARLRLESAFGYHMAVRLRAQKKGVNKRFGERKHEETWWFSRVLSLTDGRNVCAHY